LLAALATTNITVATHTTQLATLGSASTHPASDFDAFGAANTAATTANSALTTANTANATSNTANTTATSANTSANNAVTTANTAQTTANAALPKAGGTMTGQLINSTNGAASTPPVLISGIPFTGGSATTTKPLALIETLGAGSAAWNTSATMLGVNAPIGFPGNLIDLQVNGLSKAKIDPNGAMTIGAITSNSIVLGTNIKANELISTFSTTPAFAVANSSDLITLTGNLTSWTLLAGTAAGQSIALIFCQNATGGFTSGTTPSNVHGFMVIGTTASKCSAQSFIYSTTLSAWLAISPGVINQ
jgi:hypothetical protein